MLKVFAQLRGTSTVGGGKTSNTFNKNGAKRKNGKKVTKSYKMKRSLQSQVAKGSNRLKNKIQG